MIINNKNTNIYINRSIAMVYVGIFVPYYCSLY